MHPIGIHSPCWGACESWCTDFEGSLVTLFRILLGSFKLVIAWDNIQMKAHFMNLIWISSLKQHKFDSYCTILYMVRGMLYLVPETECVVWVICKFVLFLWTSLKLDELAAVVCFSLDTFLSLWLAGRLACLRSPWSNLHCATCSSEHTVCVGTQDNVPAETWGM